MQEQCPEALQRDHKIRSQKVNLPGAGEGGVRRGNCEADELRIPGW